jgi:hypothetical protein
MHGATIKISVASVYYDVTSVCYAMWLCVYTASMKCTERAEFGDLSPAEHPFRSTALCHREEPHYGEMVKVWLEAVNCFLHNPGICL